MLEEALKYLGLKPENLTEQLTADINRITGMLREKADFRYTYKLFPIEVHENRVDVATTNLTLPGKDIVNLLQHSKECVILAATLGIEAENLLLFTQKTSLSDAIIMDALAGAMIEDECNKLQDKLEQTHTLTQRYSPGYGDLPLHLQGNILNVLNARLSIGLYCTSNSILLPRKSITAIMGITGVKSQIDMCKSCILYEECNFRKGGKKCGR